MQIAIKIQVEFDTPFNVGSGVSGDTWASKPMAKDQDGLPIIPASSLKGRLRHQCEQIARALALDDRIPCGSPVAEAMCQPNPNQDDGRNPLCPTCRLFGSPWYPSPLVFSDLTLVEPAYLREYAKSGGNPVRSTVRYGVGISRQRRVAEDNLLYTVEVFQPGNILTLAGDIVGNVATENDLMLLIAGLEMLFALGSGKTRGMGWCKPNLALELDHTPINLDDLRRRWERDTRST
jgi:CRISPR/Cas system CSM-associated protein Csm3 (group 7 of RAMP superfamily)